jgi:hypothetical protein
MLLPHYFCFFLQLQIRRNNKDREHQERCNLHFDQWDSIDDDEVDQDLKLHNILWIRYERRGLPLLIRANRADCVDQ